jgi:hypothetical protein
MKINYNKPPEFITQNFKDLSEERKCKEKYSSFSLRNFLRSYET